MKNTKSLGLIAIVAVIMLAFTACADPSDPPKDKGTETEKELSGTVTISPNENVKVGTELTASYDGTEAVTLSWQWKKDGGAIDGATSDKYTPSEAGRYTVTASAAGYKSKTSAVVEVTAITTTVIDTPIANAEISIIAPVKDVAPHTTATGTGSFTIGPVSWSPDDNPFEGGVVYTATVTLTANTGHTFTGLTHATVNGQAANVSNNTGAAVTLSHTFPATDTRTATTLVIKTQPSKLAYTHGEQIDLTGLAITLTFDNGSADEVAAAAFADHNITANPAHGDHLDYATHNGHPVKVEYGNLEKDTDNLTVKIIVDTSVTYNQIADGAPDDITGPTIHLDIANGDTTATLTVTNPAQYSSIEWNINGITGRGASFTLNSANMAYNSVGEHRITLEVVKGGRPYNRTITFTVEN